MNSGSNGVGAGVAAGVGEGEVDGSTEGVGVRIGAGDDVGAAAVGNGPVGAVDGPALANATADISAAAAQAAQGF